MEWYIRRFFRIAPLYYAAIILYYVENIFILHYGGTVGYGAQSPLAIFSNVIFAHAWIPYGNNSIVPGGWSIGVEMSFYLIAPLLFLLTKERFWPGIYVIFSVALLCISVSTGPVGNNSFFYYWPPTQFPVFLCGLALATFARNWLFAEQDTTISRWWWTAGLAAFLALFPIAAAFGNWGNYSNVLAPTFFGMSYCGLVLVARGPLRSFFSAPLLRWIGSLSYSMYIVHFSVLFPVRFMLKKGHYLSIFPQFVQFAIIFLLVVVISLAISTLVYRFIERPGIEYGAKVAKRFSDRT